RRRQNAIHESELPKRARSDRIRPLGEARRRTHGKAGPLASSSTGAPAGLTEVLTLPSSVYHCALRIAAAGTSSRSASLRPLTSAFRATAAAGHEYVPPERARRGRGRCRG